MTMPLESQSLTEWDAAGIKNMLSVVIPAHNEEGHIAGTVKDLIQVLRTAGISCEILVVNDSSSDKTQPILIALRRLYPEMCFVNNTLPAGFGSAVRCGLAACRGDTVAVVMADGSDDPADLVGFYRKLKAGYDCVFGSRFIRGGTISHYPVRKLVLNRLGNSLIQAIFLVRYNDVTNAFKLYRRSTIAGIQPLLSRHFPLTVEMPLKCIVRGYKYTVIPNGWRNRKEGLSKFSIPEMGPRYLAIIFYCLIEKMFGRDCRVAQRFAQMHVQTR
jgi:dolichol-phosphate mannosyltransferase